MEHTKVYEQLFASIKSEVEWYNRGGYNKTQLHTAINVICKQVAIRLAYAGCITSTELESLNSVYKMIESVVIDER